MKNCLIFQAKTSGGGRGGKEGELFTSTKFYILVPTKGGGGKGKGRRGGREGNDSLRHEKRGEKREKEKEKGKERTMNKLFPSSIFPNRVESERGRIRRKRRGKKGLLILNRGGPG